MQQFMSLTHFTVLCYAQDCGHYVKDYLTEKDVDGVFNLYLGSI